MNLVGNGHIQPLVRTTTKYASPLSRIDPGAATLKTTSGFVRLGQRRARGREKKAENCSFLSAFCGLPVDFLPVSCGLLVPVSATPAVVVSSCSSSQIQFHFLQPLQTSFTLPPQSHQHQPAILPSSELQFPFLLLYVF